MFCIFDPEGHRIEIWSLEQSKHIFVDLNLSVYVLGRVFAGYLNRTVGWVISGELMVWSLARNSCSDTELFQCPVIPAAYTSPIYIPMTTVPSLAVLQPFLPVPMVFSSSVFSTGQTSVHSMQLLHSGLII